MIISSDISKFKAKFHNNYRQPNSLISYIVQPTLLHPRRDEVRRSNTSRRKAHSSSFANPITRHSSELNSVHGCIISRVTLSVVLILYSSNSNGICTFASLTVHYHRASAARSQTDRSTKLLMTVGNNGESKSLRV